MKNILVALLLLISLPVFAQSFHFEIKGTIKNYTRQEKIYFLYFNKVLVIDTAVVTNGTFSFKGNTEVSNEPEENYRQASAHLFIDHTGKGINFDSFKVNERRDMHVVYLEPGLTDLTITDSAYKAVIKPPYPNAGHYTLDSIYSALFKKNSIAIIQAKALYGTDSHNIVQYAYKAQRISEDEQKLDLWQFVKDHPSSPVSLYILKHIEEYYPTYKHDAPYFKALSPELKATRFGKWYAGKLDTLKLVRHNAMAPDFTMNTPDGQAISLSSLRGKYVLIDFWAAWCGPCRRQNPELVKAYNEFKDQNFTILGVSLDKSKEAWVKAIADDQLVWTQVSELQQFNSPVARLYSVTAIPQNFLIDPTGKIVAYNLLGTKLIKKLQQLFPMAALK